MTHIRRWRAVSLAVLALLLVVSPAEAKKSKKSTAKSKTKEVQTGDSLPKKPVTDAKCHDAKGVRWLAHEPITPLAIVRKGSIVEAGQHCCAPWARKGSHWFSIDSMGQIAGTFEVAGGEGYDVTQCYELSMKALQGNVGAGLYVSAGGSTQAGYVAHPTATWTPSDKERAALGRTMEALELSLVPAAKWACKASEKVALPIAERTLYFQWKPKQASAPIKMAVVGGPLLVIAYLETDGRFVSRHVESSWANACLPKAHRPLAVVDMNGDGSPEIIFHEDFGDSWSDEILSPIDGELDRGFQRVAGSVHGATA